MTYAIIDGKKAFPDSSASIKLTRENPYVRKSESYTYEISFPMAIVENLQVFGSLHRLDVTKPKKVFDSCQLYADNMLVIAGIGTVTNITNETVKLQIVGGASKVRYKTKAKELFLQDVDMGEVSAAHAHWVDPSGSVILTPAEIVAVKTSAPGGVGYTFFALGNENEDQLQNIVTSMDETYSEFVWLLYAAPQVQLMHILKCCMQAMGYTVATNDFDTAPWTQLYVCNSKRSKKLQYCLPRWKVSTFLEEFRKLFNATFVYHEMENTVDILAKGNVHVGTVSYECSDEFTSEYDEDGLEYLGTDTLSYAHRDSAFRDRVEYIPEDVFEKFEMQEYDTYSECEQALTTMTKREALTTLFYVRELDLYYYAWERAIGGYNLTRVGWFNDLRRSSSKTDLHIVPAAVGDYYADYEEKGYTELTDSVRCPFVEGTSLLYTEGGSQEEEEYVTLKEVLEDGATAEEKDAEDEIMEVAFAQGVEQRWKAKKGTLDVMGNWKLSWRAFTCSLKDGYAVTPASLALTGITENDLVPHIGQFHKGSVPVNVNNPVTIKFPCDGIPDPTMYYVFRGKRYLCAKIETTITADGVERMKTGVFYELSS